MKRELAKIYDPGEVEARLYDFWMENKYFHTRADQSKKPYTIVIPPPNITGQLHMGHALDNTMQDILIRFRRMQGYCALWLPGTDHASIATEVKIVEAMAKEGLTKQMLGREKFLERAWQWKKDYGGIIISQLKKLGSSCDWDRERFTLDEGCSKAVREVFVRLYEKGLIYRGERIISWCSDCKTSISDAEVEYEEKDGLFYHLKYPLADGSGFLRLATTRPETMLGDTAVAVHPEDDRYSHLVGKNVILPLVNKEIPVIADTYVDREFGTGVVKITPAHDPNDFEVGLRHNLPVINVLNEDATMNENGGAYQGLDIAAARKAVVEDLEKLGLVEKIETIHHNVGTCYRCKTVVEPRVSRQWFVKMKPLAEPALEVVREGKTKFIPERFEKIYYHWMENIKDWCISRQLWWGHRIPAWYCDDCGELIVSREEPHTCPKCGGAHLTQDPDTLDTWFSSALWPFSTLGWPDETEDLKFFYPTSTLVTGYDIIFFWVARMIFSGVEQMGETPFDTVLIHGLVRDAQGRKMSKSLGNGIDPLKVINEYGADALRFTLATGNSPGNDMRFSDDKIESSRNFSNKIWNAARFVLMNLTEEADGTLPESLAMEDKWIVSRYNRLVQEVTDNLERFELGMAVSKLYDFIWDIFCDWYIEISKTRLSGGGQESLNVQNVLCFVLSGTLKLLHPFMPFITEEIWQSLPHEGDSIMVSPWPVFDPALVFAAEEREMEAIMDAIRTVRVRRSEMNVPPSKKAKVYIETGSPEKYHTGAGFIQRLLYASELEIAGRVELSGAVTLVTSDARISIPLDQLVDMQAERERMEREHQKLLKDYSMIQSKLQNPGFVAKAPAQVVQAEREKLAALSQKLAKLEESLAALK